MEKDFKAFVITALVTLLIIGLYNSFLKSFTPTPVRNFIGLA